MKEENVPKRVRLKFRYKHPFIHSFLATGFVGGILILALLTLYIQSVIKTAPKITEQQLRSEATSNMYDGEGNLIWSSTEIRRNYIKYDDVPELYIDLLLNTEDATYFQDGGFSWRGIANAGLSVAKSKVTGNESSVRGGSSIEQQLIKNVAFSTDVSDRTIERKIKELWLAQQLDANWSKEQILEWYINKINMGENSYGANTIAITYFNTDLSDMKERTPENISKLAIISGLGQAPSTYNLYDNPEAVEKRRNTILYSAYENEVINQEEYEAAKAVPVTDNLQERYWRNTSVTAKVAAHNAYIMSTLDQIKSLGYDLDKTPIQIHTKLNQETDKALQDIVREPSFYKDEGQQVAVTVVDPQTGDVIAQVGSRYQSDEEAYSYNRATQRSRSTGSTVKPFIDYAPAVEYFGIGTSYAIDSSPYVYPGTNFVAQNYGSYTYGVVDMKQALRMSLNTPAIRLLDNLVGSAYAKQMLARLNMDVLDYYGGTNALGLDLSTQDMALGFAAFANGGIVHTANFIDYLEFSDGSKKSIQSTATRAMKESTAYIMAKTLEGVPSESGSAPTAAIPEFQGYLVKTGTVGYDNSDGVPRPDLVASDSWMSGSTKSVAVSVWTGYDSPNEYGNWIDANLTTRSDIFVAIMKHFNQGKDTSAFDKPDTVTVSGSGLAANYAPTDVSQETGQAAQVAAPVLPEVIDNQLTSLTPELIKVTDIAQVDTESKVPEGYVEGEWSSNYTGETKTLFNAWSNGNTSLPRISSLIDNRTYNSTSN